MGQKDIAKKESANALYQKDIAKSESARATKAQAEAVAEKTKAEDEAQTVKSLSFKCAILVAIVLVFILVAFCRFSQKAAHALAMKAQAEREATAAAQKQKLREEVDNPELRNHMHQQHFNLLGAMLNQVPHKAEAI